MMGRFFKPGAVALVSAGLALAVMTGALRAIPAGPIVDDRDQQIRDALRGVTAATSAPVEAAARKRIALKPSDPVGHAILAGCLLAQACTAFPPRRDGLTPPVSLDGRLLLQVIYEAKLALKTGPDLVPAQAMLMEALAASSRPEEIRALIKEWPASSFGPEVQRALGRGLSTLAPRGDGETALIVCDSWLARFPDDPDVRHWAIDLWWSGGELDRAAKTLDGWIHGGPPGDWSLRRVEIAILREGLEAGRAALAGVTAPGAGTLATCIAGALGEEKAVPALEELAVKGDPARPGSMMLATALLHSIGAHAAEARPELKAAAESLIELRLFPEAALALAARRRVGEWNDAETLVQADLWRKMREWKREIDTIAPLTERVDRDGHTQNGVLAGDHHFRLGRASYHQKLYDVATHEYELAAKAGKEDPELWFHIAKLLAAEGRQKESLEWIKKAASWKAPRPHAEKARAELAREAGAAAGTRLALPFGASPYLAPPPSAGPAPAPSASPTH